MTRRFGELRGLWHLLVLSACLLAFWSEAYIKALRYAGPLQALVGFFASLVPFFIIVSTRRLFQDYYRRRFGSVAAHWQDRWSDLLPAAALVLGGLWIDTANYRSGAPSAVLIAGSLLALRVTLRDWPWRAHHLIPGIGCAVGAALTASVPAMHLDDLRDVLRISFTILLTTNMVAAYLDHRFLARTLSGNIATEVGLEAAERAE